MLERPSTIEEEESADDQKVIEEIADRSKVEQDNTEVNAVDLHFLIARATQEDDTQTFEGWLDKAEHYDLKEWARTKEADIQHLEGLTNDRTYDLTEQTFRCLGELEKIEEKLKGQLKDQEKLELLARAQADYLKAFRAWADEMPKDAKSLKSKIFEVLLNGEEVKKSWEEHLQSSRSHVEKAQDNVDRLKGQLKETAKTCKQTDFVVRTMKRLTDLFVHSAVALKMNSERSPFKLEERCKLSEFFLQFRELYFKILLLMCKVNSQEAYICLDCWFILFLKDSQTDSKYFKEGRFENLADVLTTSNEKNEEQQCKDFYKGLGITDEDLQRVPLYTLIPSVFLSGERIHERGRGHRCTYKVD